MSMHCHPECTHEGSRFELRCKILREYPVLNKSTPYSTEDARTFAHAAAGAAQPRSGGAASAAVRPLISLFRSPFNCWLDRRRQLVQSVTIALRLTQTCSLERLRPNFSAASNRLHGRSRRRSPVRPLDTPEGAVLRRTSGLLQKVADGLLTSRL